MGRQVRFFESSRYYVVSNTCHQGEPWLRPSPAINQIVKYWLIRAGHKFQVRHVGFMFTKNAYTLILRAPLKNISVFMKYFQHGLSTHLNKLHERQGSIFSKRYDMETVMDDAHVLDTLREMFLLPIEQYGVHPSDWAGVSSWHCRNRHKGMSLDTNKLFVPSLVRSHTQYLHLQKKKNLSEAWLFDGLVHLRMEPLVESKVFIHQMNRALRQTCQGILGASSTKTIDSHKSWRNQCLHFQRHRKRITRQYQKAFLRLRCHRGPIRFPDGTIPPTKQCVKWRMTGLSNVLATSLLLFIFLMFHTSAGFVFNTG